MTQTDEMIMAFEEWAEGAGMRLDCLFLSFNGNPYEDADTKLAFDIWRESWGKSDTAARLDERRRCAGIAFQFAQHCDTDITRRCYDYVGRNIMGECPVLINTPQRPERRLICRTS